MSVFGLAVGSISSSKTEMGVRMFTTTVSIKIVIQIPHMDQKQETLLIFLSAK